MTALDTGIVLLTALLNAGFGIADYAHAKFVLANSAQVRVPPSWLPMLGTAKLAGGLGLMIGLFGADRWGCSLRSALSSSSSER